MIVMKFGGTSVEDANALRNVCQIIVDRLSQQLLVVVSACAGVTNALLHIAQSASEGNAEQSLAEIETFLLKNYKNLRMLPLRTIKLLSASSERR